jgi:hypothetical protein
MFRDVKFKAKDLVPIPWMVAMALQQDGWYLRSSIIWAKPNCRKGGTATYTAGGSATHGIGSDSLHQMSPNGRNRRTVWTIPTHPYPEAHFATFPPALVEPCILAGTSARGCCPVCGAPWQRVVERTNESNWEFRKQMGATGGAMQQGSKQQIGSGWSHYLPTREVYTTGWRPTCPHYPRIDEWQEIPRKEWDEDEETYQQRIALNGHMLAELVDLWRHEKTVPCTVLDCFGGTGTTAEVALKHGRSAIIIELSPDYLALARKRLEGAQLGMAL